MLDLERQLAERKDLLILRPTLNRARLRYQLVALRARVPSRDGRSCRRLQIFLDADAALAGPRSEGRASAS